MPKKGFFEGTLLPGERPERKPSHLTERLEGKQLALLHLGEADGRAWKMPDGGLGIGLELTDGGRWIVWATPVIQVPGIDMPFRFRIVWRYIPPQKIWTKRMKAHFSKGRDAVAGAPREHIQKVLEGKIIAGVITPTGDDLISPEGGERTLIEFKDGWRLALEAGPGDLARGFTADMSYRAVPPKGQRASGAKIISLGRRGLADGPPSIVTPQGST